MGSLPKLTKGVGTLRRKLDSLDEKMVGGGLSALASLVLELKQGH